MRRLGVLVVAVALVGCSALDKINPFSSGPKPKPELAPIQAKVQLRTLWQANVGAGEDAVFTPAVLDNAVFAAAKNGTLARFDGGRETWRISVGQTLSGGVGADAKLVVVGTKKGEVLAFDAATGALRWQALTNADILAAPALGEGLVAVRAGDARIFAFDAADGRRRWVYQRTAPALTLRTNAGLLFANRTVLAGFPGGKLVAISAANGAAVWEGTVALPKGATELERIADVSGTPALSGREVCAAAFQGRVACFDVGSGNPLWSRDVSSRVGVGIDERYVYASDDKGNVHALGRDGGSSVWKQDKLAQRVLTRPLALGSRVVVADDDGVVHVLSREDGALIGRGATDGSAVKADPQAVPGGFLLQTRNGGLYALAVE